VVEQSNHVVGHRNAEAGGLGEFRAPAEPALVERDHVIGAAERVGDVQPVLQAAREAVQQNHGFPVTISR
jgi:hypothetical protein